MFSKVLKTGFTNLEESLKVIPRQFGPVTDFKSSFLFSRTKRIKKNTFDTKKTFFSCLYLFLSAI